jgi:hypothetical protein
MAIIGQLEGFSFTICLQGDKLLPMTPGALDVTWP